ncbi:NADH dehydrogenase [ubiquinone] 1 alpha subcomplex assembly factor 3 isoform X1 [Enhydra lutris kenyoni]|uniref:NADH dehydrogenase [ubiquinone] 1 alpha subcomplex assembly factor 3 n=1 Tax=Enhydra lutris kenyoni TaxID=391180 RepID=A0A2Y9IY09_ENHLU|nr:NADH dehydrogenase [ubiquinone] 1 alpha subcomplex assembly factor 3 isoform X1 [Enhydra lutris kenyoni]
MVAAFVLRGLCGARAVLRCSPAELLRAPRRGHRLTPADDELYERTRISLLQRESPQIMYIDSYSSRGFMVNGNRVLGPCALLPQSVVQWNVSSEAAEGRSPGPAPRFCPSPTWAFPLLVWGSGNGSVGETARACLTCLLPTQVGSHRDITEESFSLFWLLEPRIEIVVVGTGDRTERLQPQVLQALRQRGIAVEVQDTPNACATFNFLCHEGRVTGAALIPPPRGTALTSLERAAE